MKRIIYCRIAVLTLAVVLILLGVTRNGHVDVMNKAVRICLECIGIG